MPVADIPVHEKTIKRTKHAFCKDRLPMRGSYAVTVKEVIDDQYTGRWIMQTIDHTMTTECQAAKEKYAECEECKWNK